MKFSRLTNIAIRNSHYAVSDLAVPASLLLFAVALSTLIWSF